MAAVVSKGYLTAHGQQAMTRGKTADEGQQ